MSVNKRTRHMTEILGTPVSSNIPLSEKQTTELKTYVADAMVVIEKHDFKTHHVSVSARYDFARDLYPSKYLIKAHPDPKKHPPIGVNLTVIARSCNECGIIYPKSKDKLFQHYDGCRFASVEEIMES